MSDSSNDGSKEPNKDSEVSSSCNDSRHTQPTAAEGECDATREEPKPRSLSPDTSDAMASNEQGEPSHQVASSVADNSTVAREGESLTSTTGNGRNGAESSHQEAGVSSGQISVGDSSQHAVSSAHLDKDDTKSSSSDEYFEAAESSFEPAIEIPDVSGSRDPNSGQLTSNNIHPWEVEISSESNSEDTVTVSSVQPSVARQTNEATASATLRLSQKSWEMLLSYESSSDEGEAESSDPQLSFQATVSGSGADAGHSRDQVSEAREISTTQQLCASVSPSNSQDLIGDEVGHDFISGEIVTASVSSLRNEELNRASSSELQLEGSDVSGSHDRSEKQVEAGSSMMQMCNPDLSGSQHYSSESQDDGSSDQLLTSSGQPSTSQEVDVTESRRTSEEIESSPHQQLSSSHQVYISNSSEDMEIDTQQDEILISSGQVGSPSLEPEISESQGISQEAEAIFVSETVDTQRGTSQPEAMPSSQGSQSTVSASDDLGTSSSLQSPSSFPQLNTGRSECSESGQSSSTQEVRGDVSRSSDSPEDEGMSSSTLQTGPRPDSPSSQKDTDRQVPGQIAKTSVNNMSSIASSRSSENEVEMSSSSGLSTSRSQMIGVGPSAEASLFTNQPAVPSVSSASVDKPTESSDEETESASVQQSIPQRPRMQVTNRMSVLAQQLTVSSASSRGSQSGMLRQLISSHNETGVSSRPNSVGPDSTTMDQSNAYNTEEVSTTEEEQLGQVSTSQQRVVSTSWPPHAASRVSSSADSSAGHISTSAQLGGLLASRLSRDPQVSTSANVASTPSRDHDVRDGGASSTTSGLRGLLSSGPRPIGVSSSSRPHLSFSPPSQSCDQSSRHTYGESVLLQLQKQSAHTSRNPQLSNTAQPCTSSLTLQDQRTLQLPRAGTSRFLATAPGDQFPDDPDKKSKKRKKSHEKEDPLPPAKHPQPGPSKEPPKEDLGSSASLVEQLRKAGVIITPVPSALSQCQANQDASASSSRDNNSVRIRNIAESAVSSPPTHISISRITEQIDSSSSDDIQVLGLFGKSDSEPQHFDGGKTGPTPAESVGGSEGQFVVMSEFGQDIIPVDDEKPTRKRRPRKQVEINPDMLRPKRPRKAKEKPESEDDKEKPKRGRKKKIKVEAQNDAVLSEISADPQLLVAKVSTPPTIKKKKSKEILQKAAPKVVSEPPSKPQDEDTRMSALSAEDSQQSRPDVAFRKSVLPVLDVHAETLVEYQWPLNDRLAESYMIQEQVTQYLGIKSFKRKYPDLKRRPVEAEEREFLQERGLVAEALCDLGLTAVPSAEVLDIMSADFHEKYEEYRRAVRDKQAREVAGKQKAAAAASGERGRQVDQKMRAMQSAAKWNASLNKDRREERRCCCDLQTMSVQFPQSRIKAMTKEVPKLGTYPVSLIPGQFTDYYKKYTPAELRYLPLNTVLYGPMLPNEEMEEKGSEESHSDTEDSSSSDETSSSSSSDGTQDTEETGSTAAETEQDIPSASAASGPPAGSKCKVCSLPGNQPDSMVVCAQCNSAGHLNCLGLSADMLPHIRRYAWQCTDCKTCIQCKDPADEDKMLFCDLCDRGYHIYCVGLRKVPEGRWHCQECAVCGSCGSLDPAGTEAASPPASPEKIPPQWQHEFKRGEKGARVYAQTLCVPCSKLWRRGSFCQLCLRCFRKPDVDTMLSCSVCDKWMHAECCSLAPGDVPRMSGSSFVCEVCQEASQVRAPAANTTTTRIVKVAARV